MTESAATQNPPQTVRESFRKPRPIQVVGDIGIVPLSRGLSAIIDADDVPLAQGHSWYAHTNRTSGPYAARWSRDGVVYLHRVIASPGAGHGVDHANGCSLDNRRANLRPCTHSQNSANAKSRPNRLGVRGVWERNGSYRASVQVGGKTTHLGPFATVEEAAAAYQRAARAAFGRFARKE